MIYNNYSRGVRSTVRTDVLYTSYGGSIPSLRTINACNSHYHYRFAVYLKTVLCGYDVMEAMLLSKRSAEMRVGSTPTIRTKFYQMSSILCAFHVLDCC